MLALRRLCVSYSYALLKLEDHVFGCERDTPPK